MLDRNKIGHEFDTFSVEVEKGRLKFFAKAIGESNPIYSDEVAARAAGYKTIPAPPTFTLALDMESPNLMPLLAALDMEVARILHGAQEFEYYETIYAGDTITVTSAIKDMFSKKSGALEFVILENNYTNQEGLLLAKANQTLVYRNP